MRGAPGMVGRSRSQHRDGPAVQHSGGSAAAAECERDGGTRVLQHPQAAPASTPAPKGGWVQAAVVASPCTPLTPHTTTQGKAAAGSTRTQPSALHPGPPPDRALAPTATAAAIALLAPCCPRLQLRLLLCPWVLAGAGAPPRQLAPRPHWVLLILAVVYYPHHFGLPPLLLLRLLLPLLRLLLLLLLLPLVPLVRWGVVKAASLRPLACGATCGPSGRGSCLRRRATASTTAWDLVPGLCVVDVGRWWHRWENGVLTRHVVCTCEAGAPWITLSGRLLATPSVNRLLLFRPPACLYLAS